MALAPEELAELHSSQQRVLDRAADVDRARARTKIAEGSFELEQREHAELVGRMIEKLGGRRGAPLEIDEETGELRKIAKPA